MYNNANSPTQKAARLISGVGSKENGILHEPLHCNFYGPDRC